MLLFDRHVATGGLAFLAHQRNLIYRDLGGCPAPMNSFLMLQGLETLPGRMDRHCDNALKLARFLSQHPDVSWVNYPGLEEADVYACIAYGAEMSRERFVEIGGPSGADQA